MLAPVLVVCLLLALAGCGGDDGPPARPIGSGRDVGRDAGHHVGPAQAGAREQRVLDQRARAVREHDLRGFLRHVDHRDKALMARQRRYFANLSQLPLARFGYRVLPREWQGLATARSWGPEVHVPQVRMTLQLAGFDSAPVVRTVGFVFSFRHGRPLLVSDRTTTGEPLFRGAPSPWDLTSVQVRREGGVLGIFDDRTASTAPTVMAAVTQGIQSLDRALPFTWPGRVVVYSVADPRVLDSFHDVPGGAIDHLGAMTFPTYSRGERGPVASTRMLLLPSSVRAGQPFLGRITRHELSHIAIGVRDDGSPAWVSEGLAEYLGARGLSLRDRIIPTSALTRAREADATMPASSEFNGPDQEWHYALSWMACDYIAATFGESRLWELVDAMHNGGSGTTDAEQDRVLDQVLGFDNHELARRAAARIRNVYG